MDNEAASSSSQNQKMIIFLFALLISFVCFWYGFKFIKLYITVKGWAKTEATVLSKKIQLHEKYTAGRSSPYGIKVDYRYVFNHKEYTNNKVYLVELINGQANHTESSATKVVEELKDKREIYVNPDHPEQSVLFCSGIGLYIIVFAMGFVSLLMGLAALY